MEDTMNQDIVENGSNARYELEEALQALSGAICQIEYSLSTHTEQLETMTKQHDFEAHVLRKAIKDLKLNYMALAQLKLTSNEKGNV